MMVTKTQGPLQQHLRLNVRDLTTFDDTLETVGKYYQSRHLANWKHMSSNQDTSGTEKGKKGGNGKCKFKGTWKGKGKRNWKGKGKGKKAKGQGNGKGTGCFIRGSHSHWSGECPQKQVGAIVEDTPKSKDDDWSWNMKIGMVTKDGLKMIGLVQVLMTLTGPMMIGHGMSQIGMPGMMVGPSQTWTILRPLQLITFLNHHINCNQTH